MTSRSRWLDDPTVGVISKRARALGVSVMEMLE
jgi:hypothetical protein